MRPGPGVITKTRSASSAASRTLWVMKKIVEPVRAQMSCSSSCSDVARLRIEGGEGLVHQQHPRLDGQRAGELHALLHAAGELVHEGLLELRQVHQLEVLSTMSLALAPCGTPFIFSPNSTLARTFSHG